MAEMSWNERTGQPLCARGAERDYMTGCLRWIHFGTHVGDLHAIGAQRGLTANGADR